MRWKRSDIREILKFLFEEEEQTIEKTRWLRKSEYYGDEEDEEKETSSYNSSEEEKDHRE